MIPFRRTCKQVTALVIAREDRVLSWPDQLALRLHMVVCTTCPRFSRQVLTMRNALQQWRNYENHEPLNSSCDPQPPGQP